MGKFIVNLTHDVDRVNKTYQYITQDLIKGKIKKLKYLFLKDDPYWCIDKIIEIEEKYNVKSSFFFLEESIKFFRIPIWNWYLALGRYKFSQRKVSNAIKYLHNNGWEIGLHGSYNSFRSGTLLKKEKSKLEKVTGNSVIGIRQHHLNLDISSTWQLQKEVGFLYDASYGKKRGIGFIDTNNIPFIDKESNLLVIPITFMEFNLLNKAGGDVKKAKELLIQIIDEAKLNYSVLSVIWHQRMFNEDEFPGYYYLYEELIKECKKRNADFMTCSELYHHFM